MKTCTMIGNMGSESGADNYPVILLCEDCFEADSKRGVNARVLSFDDYDSGYGIQCEECESTVKDEQKRRKWQHQSSSQLP